MPRLFITIVTFWICAGCTPASGERIDLVHQAESRNYYLHIPETVASGAPVLIVMHGGGTRGKTKGRTMADFTGLNEVADREGFVVAYPSSLNGNWNDGRDLEAQHVDASVDDVGFIDAVVDDVASRADIDWSKVVVSGVSNGGFMTQRMICERAQRYAAGISFIATMPTTLECDPAGPVTVRWVVGTEDPLVPFEGGPVAEGDRGEAMSSDDAFAFWSSNNQCLGPREVVGLPDREDDGTTVSIETATGCRAPVSRVIIEDGGHTWPGGSQYAPKRLVGTVSKEVRGQDLVWEVIDGL